MPEDVLTELSAQTTWRELERNELLFRQGDPSESLYVVADGRIAIVSQAGDGRETVIAVLEHGGLFGETHSSTTRAHGRRRTLVDTTVVEIAHEPVRAVLQTRRTCCG